MPTTADLEMQERFERKQIKGGLERFRSNTKKLCFSHSFRFVINRNPFALFSTIY
jgi:hypothetical protein